VRLLIIDDEPVSRRILKRLLSRLPELAVHEADNGETAWTLLGEATPGLILCDLSMPRMDGVTFIRKVRGHPAFGDIPVIVTSATKDREIVLELKELRILDYLLKPFDLVQTFARLERHLQPLIAADRAAQAAAAAAVAAVPAKPEPVAAAQTPASEPEEKAEPSPAP